jgi:hypothetical protein
MSLGVNSPRCLGGSVEFLLSVFAPLDGGELLAGLLLGNIAPFELTVGISIHFPAYLSLILRIKFVPEPSEWVMLVAGFGSLIVLYRRHDRGPRLLQRRAKS